MPIFYRSVYAISQLGAIGACLMLIAMVGHIVLEILLRNIFSTSTFVQDEFVGYAVAACVFWSLGYTLEHSHLIRVNVLLHRFNERARRIAEVFCGVAAFVCTGYLAWFFWLRLTRNWTRGTVSGSIAAVPMWIPEAIILTGLAIFALQLIAYTLRQITGHPSLAHGSDDAFVE
jgi:TRAP-type C4-dicarboxylate transport system permease small subunit